MQSLCGLWEDLEKAKQSDSDNAKLQQEVYELLDGTEGTFGCDSKVHPCLLGLNLLLFPLGLRKHVDILE
jgi:hypothetical protein